MTMTVGSTAGGAVYDRGYRPYTGPVGGRWAARWALFRLTIRRALGIRRSWRQKLLPWALLGIATVPAIVNVGIKVATRGQPVDEVDLEFISYRDYVNITSTLLLFVAITAPDAVCPDRRNGVLSLIFSRPLTGADYVLAKVSALAAVIFGFGFFPQVVLFVGQTMVHEDGALDYVRENAEVMWQVPASVAVLALLYAALGVALSALSNRRIVGGVAIFAVALVTSVIAGVLVGHAGIEDGGDEHGASTAAEESGPARERVIPVDPDQPGPEPGTYPEDYEHGFPEPGTYEEDYEYENERSYEEDPNYEDGSPFALIDVFQIPLFLRDVIFLGHIEPGSMLGGVDNGGVLSLLVYLVLLALSIIVLLWRYREVQL